MARTNFNWRPDYPRVLADVTGDGSVNIIGFGPDGAWVGFNRGDGTFTEPKFASTGFAYNDGWRVDAHPRFAADLTGNGCADLLGFGDDGVWVALNAGPKAPDIGEHKKVESAESRFQEARYFLNDFGTSKGWRCDKHLRLLADLSGSGSLDVVGFGDDGVLVARGDGKGGFRPPEQAVAGFCFNQGWRVETHSRFLADITGDGRPDIIGFGDDGVWVTHNKGDGTFEAPAFILAEFKGWFANRYPLFMADITGDGRAAVVGFGENGVWVSFNDGSGGFRPPEFNIAEFGFDKGWRLDQHVRLVTDITGDGRADIVCIGADGVWVALNRGDGSFEPPRFVLAEFGTSKGWQGAEHPRFVTPLKSGGPLGIVGLGDDGVWTSPGDGTGTFASASFILRAFGRQSNRDLIMRDEIVRPTAKPPIKHLFVLMLENRSFDHFLGSSNITGTDIATGEPTAIDGLTSEDGNSHGGKRYRALADASDRLDSPGHDFGDALEQLCGPGAAYPPRGAYPEPNNSGFVSSYAGRAPSAAGAAMLSFPPERLKVLNRLAREFLVCDRWFSSLPGPTEPNRMFVHAATSGEYDDSPDGADIGVASTIGGHGWSFRGGDVFDSLRQAKVKFRIYAGDATPNVGEQKSISNSDDVIPFRQFAKDLASPSFDASYVFIEPDYGISQGAEAEGWLNDHLSFVPEAEGYKRFWNGTSQHPPGSVAAGERFIKAVYEALRSSPVWESSMLVITWDEHGGFYDHVAPPPAVNAGAIGKLNQFNFEQLGLRVPTVIVSPLVPKNTISHQKLEHSSVVQTLVDLFELPGLEHSRVRTGTVSGFSHFATLSAARADTPKTLEAPVPPTPGMLAASAGAAAKNLNLPIADAPDKALLTLSRNILIQHLKLEPDKRDEILRRHAELKTEGDLMKYVREVATLTDQRRAARP